MVTTQHHHKLIDAIRHYACPLHVYCRLRDIGVNKALSRDIAKMWEWLLVHSRLIKLGGYTNGKS